MREIKFRAWDKEEEIMTYFEDESYVLNGNMTVDKWVYSKKDCENIFDPCYKAIEAEIMQYTGLKDKNGKEIYEGDIVKAHFTKGHWKYNDKSYYGYKNGIVEYCVDCFILYIENYKEKIYPLSAFGDRQIKDLEVIGNIYDNKELLEE